MTKNERMIWVTVFAQASMDEAIRDAIEIACDTVTYFSEHGIENAERAFGKESKEAAMVAEILKR